MQGNQCNEPDKNLGRSQVMNRQNRQEIDGLDGNLPHREERRMKVIFLDDDPNRQKRMKSMLPCIKQVWTADEAITELGKYDKLDAVFLDHDLGGEVYVDSNTHNTGMTVAKWIAENKEKGSIGEIIIHTFNPSGGKYMYHALRDKFKWRLTVAPFLSDLFNESVKALLAPTQKE